jgi:hypothetical protein
MLAIPLAVRRYHVNTARLLAAPALALAAVLITPALIDGGAATACTAAGDYQTSSRVQETLAERYGT